MPIRLPSSIKTLSRLGVGATLLLAISFGAVSYRTIESSRTSREQVAAAVDRLSTLQLADHSAMAEYSSLTGFYTVRDPELLTVYQRNRQLADEALQSLSVESGTGDKQLADYARSALATHQEMNAVIDRAMLAVLTGDIERALSVVKSGNYDGQAIGFSQSFEAPMNAQRERVAAFQRKDQSSQLFMTYALAGMGLAVMAFILGFGLLLGHWVLRPLAAISSVARRIADGDLSARVSDPDQSEIGQLGSDINEMAASLIQRSEQLNSYLSRNLEARTRELEVSNRDLVTRTWELSRLSSILEATTDFVGICDPEGNALYVNRGGRAMAGLPAEAEITGKSLAEFYTAPAFDLIARQALPAAIRNGSWFGETAIRTSNGEEIPVSQVILAHHGEDGEVAYLSTICRDISETKELYEARARALEMEQAFKAREHEQAKLASLADSMSAGLVMIGAQGEVSYCNSQLGELLNCDTNALVGSGEDELESALSRNAANEQAAIAMYRELRDSDESWRTRNFNLVRPVKRVLRCSMFQVKDASGRDLGKGLLMGDITRESEVDQLKDEFIGIASHELRTPLTGIMGFAELLRDSLDPDSSERQWAGRVNEEARRLAALVSDLLDASRIDSGSMELHSEAFSVEDRLAEVVEGALSGRPGRVIKVSHSEPVELVADQAKFIQVVTNLLDNALKYSPDNEPVELSYRIDGQGLELEVTDHGAGIPRDHMERIFERFHRLEAANPTVRGTGLGLYITRQLVNRMGGRISVQSKEGEGSTFLLSLPVNQPLAQAAAA